MKIKIKVNPGDKNPAKKAATQADVNAANAMAKRLAMKKGLLSGEETYAVKKVGDELPRFIDAATGKDTDPTGLPPTKRASKIPSYVKPEDIKSEQGVSWY